MPQPSATHPTIVSDAEARRALALMRDDFCPLTSELVNSPSCKEVQDIKQVLDELHADPTQIERVYAALRNLGVCAH